MTSPTKKPRGGSIRSAILLPFTLLVLLGFITSGTLYILTSRAAVGEVVERLAVETTAHVESRLSRLLESPQRVGLTISEFARLVDDPEASAAALQRVFYYQLSQTPDINIASIGFSNGEYAEAQRLSDGTILVGRAGRATGGALENWTCDDDGFPIERISCHPGYDPRTRPWYQKSAQALGPRWTDIYPYYSNSDLAIAASIPVLEKNAVKAVVSVTITLNGLNAFLDSIRQSETGLIAIVDRDGFLIAVSGGGPRLILPDGSRVQASASSNPLLAKAIECLGAAPSGSSSLVRFKIAGKQHVAGAALVTEEGWDIGWRVISILPESVYTARLARSDFLGGLIFVVLLVIALGTGWVAVSRVIQPLSHLEVAVRDLAQERFAGESAQTVRELSLRRDEIGLLATSFENMRRRLSESFDSLHGSLEEKEVLLKEVHHRVKNNLQIISSMLSIQAGEMRDPDAREAFASCQERIQAMAFVHEDVYQSAVFTEVDMGDYLEKICDSLRWSRSGNSASVSINVGVEDVRLSLSQAIPCGLIVNELVVNSLKHAFPPGASGSVSVSMRQAAGEVNLIVEDDGIGKVRPDSDEKGEGIGHTLVDSLVAQLRGSLHSDVGSNGSGLCMEIRFSLDTE